jgi:hypothetical protein
MVCDLLKNELEYSLQANRKIREGGDNPDRDAQFEYINKEQSNSKTIISQSYRKRRKILGTSKIMAGNTTKKGPLQK